MKRRGFFGKLLGLGVAGVTVPIPHAAPSPDWVGNEPEEWHRVIFRKPDGGLCEYRGPVPALDTLILPPGTDLYFGVSPYGSCAAVEWYRRTADGWKLFWRKPE